MVPGAAGKCSEDHTALGRAETRATANSKHGPVNLDDALSSGLRQVNVEPFEPHSARGRLTRRSPRARSTVMLAEIYMLRLEAAARAAKEAATSSSRFVPVSLPGPKAS